MKNFKSIIRITKQINYILTKKQKRNSVIVFFVMIVEAGVNLLGVSSVYPFLQLLMDDEALYDKPYLAWYYYLNPNASKTSAVVFFGIVIACVFILKNVVSILCNYVQARYSAGVRREISVRILDSYMKRSYEYFINTDTNVILRGLNGDVDAVYNIILNAFQAIAEFLSVIIISVYLIYVDAFIALASLLISLVCFVGITLGFKGIKKKLGKETRHLQAVSGSASYQIINGIKEIMVLDRRGFFVRKYEKITKDVAQKNIIGSVVDAAPDRILEAICMAGIMMVLCLKISSGVDLDMFIPTLGVFVTGFFRIMPSISRMSTRINNIVYFVPGMENTFCIMKDDEEIDKAREIEKQLLDKRMEVLGRQKLEFNHSITVENITWKYRDSTKNVLDGLCLTVHKGESVALIGMSGGGKSTLVDIFMTLFKPQSGTIKMDGIDIFLMQEEWRKHIGYVPQSVFLMGNNVRSNVAFGIAEEEVSEEKVWKALEQAQMKEFIEGLPNQLNTPVGERGVKFSGGQRQRIAIARALYNDPEILILDEATAALDNETESAFMSAIEALQGEKTIILVAHRLTTIRNCDRAYEIKDGIAYERSVKEVLGGVEQ